MLSIYSKYRAYGAPRCPNSAIISSYKAFTQLSFPIHRIKHDALYVIELQDSHEVEFLRYMVRMSSLFLVKHEKLQRVSFSNGASG